MLQPTDNGIIPVLGTAASGSLRVQRVHQSLAFPLSSASRTEGIRMTSTVILPLCLNVCAFLNFCQHVDSSLS